MTRFILTAISAAALLSSPLAATAQGFAPKPAELKLAFDSYTKHAGIDPQTCSFGIWNSNVLGQDRKAMMANAFATCRGAEPYRVCTRLASKLNGEAPVDKGCITGFNKVSFLPVTAMTPKGGFFVVVYGADDRPVRLALQLTLGFGPRRDFCELSARLIDADAESLVEESYYSFTQLLLDKSACKDGK